MDMGDFRGTILSFRPTPWRKSIGMFERAARRIISAGRPSSVSSSSARKPAPMILAHSELLFSAFMDNLPGFAWMKDIEGHYLYVNKRLEQLTPYQNGWLGKTDADLWPDEMAAIFRGTDQKVIATRKTLEIVEIYMVDGEQRHAWVSKFPIFDSAGAVVMVGGSSADITKRIYAEEQLRQSKSQLAEAQRLASVGSWNWDIRNNTHNWSDELYHIYGLHPQESVPSYETFIELVHPDHRAVISGAIEHALKTQEPINSYLRIIRPDGTERIIHSRGNTVCDISGSPIRMHGTVQDVTERKRAEDALREAERKYRDIFENAGEGIFQSTPDGRYIAANPTLARMYGFASPEELIQSRQDISRQVYVDPTRREEFKRQLKEQDAVRGFEHQIFRKDGSKIWISVNARAVRDEHGAIQYYEGTAQDVTQRKLVEKELSRSEEMYRGLVEQAPDAIFIASPNLHFIDLNARACELCGYTKDEILQMSIPDFMPPEDILSNPLRLKELQEGKTVVAERRLRRKDGTLVPVEVSTKILSDGRLQAIVRDISERKQAEAALQESEERFRQLSEAAFEAIILHDNGTILEVNRSFCRMYGYEREEVIGKTVLDLALPEFRKQLLQIVRLENTDPYESPALRKDGTVFRAEVAGKPINYQGRVVRVAAIRDITEKKRSERRQAAQHAVTRVLAESATLAEATPQLLKVICESLRWKMGEFWRVCDSTNLLRCVETWHVSVLDATSFIEASRQTKLSPGAGLPGRVWQSGQPAWIPDVMTDPGFLRAGVAAKVGLRGAVAFPILLGNHTLGVMLFFSRRSPEVDEDLLKIMSAIGSQIGQFTEGKRAEEARLASERRYRDIVTFAPVGIYQSLRDGTLVTANKALAEMLGYASVDELIKVKLGSGMYLSEDERERLIREHEIRGYPADLELQWKTKDGSPIWIQLSAHAIRGANGVTEYWEGFVRDITSRKRAEEALRQSEARYRAIVQDQTELVCRSLPNGTLTFVNDAYCRYFGKQREELIGTTLLPLIAEQDVEAVKEHLASLSSLNSIEPLEHWGYNATGELRWQQWTNRVIRDAEGGITEFQSVGRDITERKRAEEALQEAELKYRAIFENAEDGIFQTTPEGKTITANPALARMLGFDSPEKLISERTDIGQQEYVDPAQRDEFKRLLNEQDVLQGFEYEVYRRDRSRIWVSESVRAVRNENGTLLYYEGTTKDITVQKRAEEALLASERRYRDIVTFAPVGIYQSLRDGTLVTANKALAEMLGYASVDELIKVKLGSGMYLSEDERERLIREHEVRGYPVDRELQWKTKDGSPIWIQLSAHAIRGANGVTEYWEGFVRDITERKQAEEGLRKAEQKYRDIFENAGEGIFQSTPEGQFLAANPALARIHGYESPEELMGSLTDISTQIYVDSKRRDEFRRLLAEQGFARAFEHQVFKKDGSRIWITVNARAVKDAEGRIRYYEGTAQDITERKRAEERLREYEKVVEGLDEMIVVVDRDYRYLLANRAYLRYRGLEKEKLIGRLVTEIVDRPAFEKGIKKNLASAFQGQVVKHEMKFTYPEVGERDLCISYFPIEGREGVDRVACVLRDVTERKQAEQKLAYHARLLEQVHDAIIAVDERLTLTAWNHAAEQMYGWTAGEVLGRDIRDVVRSNKSEAERAEVLRAVDQKGRHRTASIHHRKDGAEINVEGTIMAMRNGDGRILGYAFAYHDVTERKRAEEATRTYSRRLIEAQEAERQSISRELHDQIGQVLTAVRINLDTFAKSDDRAKTKMLIEEGVTLVDQALQQVRNLSFELRPSLLDDLGLASALRWYADRYGQRGNIRVTTRIALAGHQRRLPREMETVCFRIVQEALTNVARHAQAKRVLIDLGTSDDGILLSIKDDGVGFDKHSRNPTALPHLLGLRGMEERALALGGKLEIYSAPSRGTEIRVHFPNGE